MQKQKCCVQFFVQYSSCHLYKVNLICDKYVIKYVNHAATTVWMFFQYGVTQTEYYLGCISETHVNVFILTLLLILNNVIYRLFYWENVCALGGDHSWASGGHDEGCHQRYSGPAALRESLCSSDLVLSCLLHDSEPEPWTVVCVVLQEPKMTRSRLKLAVEQGQVIVHPEFTCVSGRSSVFQCCVCFQKVNWSLSAVSFSNRVSQSF